MAKKILDFTVDILQNSYTPAATLKQLDNAILNIQVIENGQAKGLTGQTIKLFARRRDGTIVEQRTGININNNNTVNIDLKNNALAVAGMTLFELELTDVTGTISTATFIIKVSEKIGIVAGVESTNELDTLKEVEVYVTQAKREIQEFRTLQQQMLTTNNNINVQEDLRVQAENLRIEAELNREKSQQEFNQLKTNYFGKEFDTPQERFMNEFEYLNNGEEKGSFLPFSASKNHKIQESIEGKTRNMILEGETIQNLLPKSTIILNSSNSSKAFKILDIKANTSFFISVNITAKKAPSNGLKCGFKNREGTWNYYSLTTGVGFQSKKFELDYDITDITFYISSDEFVSTPDANITFIEPMCYISEKEILGYFEGIRSVGGKDNQISILSCGKNLFNYEMEIGSIDAITGINANHYPDECRTKEFINIENLGTLTIKYFSEWTDTTNIILYKYDKDKNYLGYVSTPKSSITFGTEGLGYIRFRYKNTNLNPNVMIIETEEIPEIYEPYKENNKDVMIPWKDGLKGINNVKDEINSITNKATQRIGKYVFTGDEDWVIGQNPLTNTLRFAFNNNFIKSGVGHFMNNKIKTDARTTYEVDEENMQQSGEVFFIRVLKSKLPTQDVDGFKTLLKQWKAEGNPLVVYYPLAEPIEYDLNQDLNLNTYDDLTYISTEATSTFSAPVVISNTIARLNRENKTLEKENVRLKEETKNLTIENEYQQIDIDNNQLATVEIFEMIIGTMEVSNQKINNYKIGGITMVEVYVSLIIKGKKKIEDVPAIIRTQVETMLRELGVVE